MTPSPTERSIAQLNRLAERRFRVEVQVKKATEKHDAMVAALNARHAARLEKFSEQSQRIDSQIWQLITEYKSSLFQGVKRSFATMLASFQLRTAKAHTIVVDKAGIMRIARQHGLVRHVAKPPKHGWVFDQHKFLDWLEKHPEERELFDEYVDYIEDDETLTIKPNTGYTVDYDGKRISPPSTSVKKP